MHHLLAPVPPMGWNSWNTFYDQINEALVFEIADAMCELGLNALGYEYIIIDDCWQSRMRDGEGCLVADPEKFPHGMKYVADYVHKKGLKIGIYSCCGTRTCANYPGSFEHEFTDAKTFAQWGIDYLKYDNCHRPESLRTPELYHRMSMALRNSGRDILLAACQWGRDDVQRWIRSSGAHTFRSSIDITDSWNSIANIAWAQLENQAYNGPGCFNDMDMLVVGMHGISINPETNMGGCTDTEYQTHFALWCMMNSPLIIGCNIRQMSQETRKILCNKNLIAINQDPEVRGCYKVDVFQNPDAFILIRPLSGGDYAVGFFNFSDVAADISLHFWDMGLSYHSGVALSFYDCIEDEDLGVAEELLTKKVEAHGCKVFRCRIVEK